MSPQNKQQLHLLTALPQKQAPSAFSIAYEQAGFRTGRNRSANHCRTMIPTPVD
jgi:hypothetical protein